jgi:pimeloyl-ACP methyl ester carboxylesterase
LAGFARIASANHSTSFHIGPAGQRIFCTLDEPASPLVRDAGVVICYPVGHEYFRLHRSLTRMAHHLAENGFNVLRFDYRGTGDSEGRFENMRLQNWLEDIRDASAALVSHAGVSEVVLMGVRLGAALALRAAARFAIAKTLVLWDLVEDGAEYTKLLLAMQSQVLSDLDRFREPRKHESMGELIGMPYSTDLLDDISSLQPVRVTDAKAGNIVLVVSKNAPSVNTITLDWRAGEAMVTTHRLARDYGWANYRRIEEIIIDPVEPLTIANTLKDLHQ